MQGNSCGSSMCSCRRGCLAPRARVLTARCVQLTAEDYELPTLTKTLRDIGREVTLGRGFALIKCASCT